MEQKHISAMQEIHKTKNEEFINDIVSYIEDNNITEDDFFSWWNNQDFNKEETKLFLEDMDIIAIDWDFYFGE
tara:strand:+ start:438 stop:656 length:219 start_codon:yes stop_codon:yes gene_type:complete